MTSHLRSRAVPALGLSLLALTLAATPTSTANAHPPSPVAIHQSGEKTHEVSDSLPGTVCARNNGVPNGNGITAQRFERAWRQLSSHAAADFTPRRPCVVTSVDIPGQWGTGTAKSITISIRRDLLGRPGATRCKATLAAPGPSFTVPVSDCTLRKGRTYWLAVQVDQNFGTDGQWFWTVTDERTGLNDAWKNRRDGFDTGCTDWTYVETCFDWTAEAVFSVNQEARA